MTAGSWIYIGTQGIGQGTYQTFLALAGQCFGGTLTGRVVLTAGLGGMGGAQPLAVTMNGGVVLCVEVDPARLHRRLDTGWLDEEASSVEDGLRRARAAADAGRAVSIGVVANAAEAFPALLAAGAAIDVVTDQTSAHDPLHGYVPPGLALDKAAALRSSDPDDYVRRARAGMAVHCEAMAGFADAGAEVFDYGNSLRAGAVDGGLDRERAFSYPGFVPAYLRPLFCQGLGPFRWVALSGDAADIAATDAAVRRAFPDDDGLQRWLRLAAERVPFQGLPARICWLGYGQRDAAGLAFNDLVRRGDVGAPIARAAHRPRHRRRPPRRRRLPRGAGGGPGARDPDADAPRSVGRQTPRSARRPMSDGTLLVRGASAVVTGEGRRPWDLGLVER